MKQTLLFFVFMLPLVLSGCSEEDDPELTVSKICFEKSELTIKIN